MPAWRTVVILLVYYATCFSAATSVCSRSASCVDVEPVPSSALVISCPNVPAQSVIVVDTTKCRGSSQVDVSIRLLHADGSAVDSNDGKWNVRDSGDYTVEIACVGASACQISYNVEVLASEPGMSTTKCIALALALVLVMAPRYLGLGPRKNLHVASQGADAVSIPIQSNESGPFVWKLRDADDGRQRWETVGATQAEFDRQQALFDAFDASKNVNTEDLVYRQRARAQCKDADYSPLKHVEGGELASAARKSARQAAQFLASVQGDDGHWPADYGGPMFLLPGALIAMYIGEVPIEERFRDAMVAYLRNHQNSDGGWGIHIESASTVFGSCLNYCALRILGVPAEDVNMIRGREFIRKRGGAVYCPSWGKFWLSLLGVLDWSINDSIMPELWLLPEWIPVHPSRMWCHARMVYLPMAYCYGKRLSSKVTPLVAALRSELLVTSYETTNWRDFRGACAADDLYQPPSLPMKVANVVLNAYEAVHIRWIRERALDFILNYVKAEDEQTKHVCIGPVNKVVNMVCVLHAEGRSTSFEKHIERMFDYFWIAEDGMKMQGYNGSQLWDTAFIAQSILEGDTNVECPTVAAALREAYKYMKNTQILEDAPDGDRWYRHPNRGAWPFSTRDHGWAITDCTGDALKAVLQLHAVTVGGETLLQGERIDTGLLEDATDILLGMQNDDGGWATYELKRSPSWLELFNSSEVFRNIMVDYTYPECSSSALQGLLYVRKALPSYRAKELDTCISDGLKYLHTQQRADGAIYGSWAVSFTYAAWYVNDGLSAAGHTSASCHAMKKACTFLLQHQNADGGWGESFQSAVDLEYRGCESLVVNTAWAVLALLAARHSDPAPIERGVQFLLEKQRPNGDWPQERISGQFNGGCMITYTYYRNAFPTKALGRYARMKSSPPPPTAEPCFCMEP